jgi:hypothetical protein
MTSILLEEKLILNARLLDRVLQAPIFTVKNIPHSCCLAILLDIEKTLFIRWLLYQIVWCLGSIGVASSMHVIGSQALD